MPCNFCGTGTIHVCHEAHRGDREQRHSWGYGCGDCPACELRAIGYGEWVGRP